MNPPGSIDELQTRAEALAGRTIAELARHHGMAVSGNPRRTKGLVGQLAELALGATAASRPEPDFNHLGVELKTVPINAAGNPAESTYVCVAPMRPAAGNRFEQSPVAAKLAHVLWLPIESSSQVPLEQRRFGLARLWRPSAADWARLKTDWEELTEQISLGQVQSITARHGVVLQLRPKGRNSRDLVAAMGPQGNLIQTNPRGFYLRAHFTSEVLSRPF
jgi:DNA mismatch repair protein MutH